MSSILSAASTVARVLCSARRPAAVTRVGSSGILSLGRRSLSAPAQGPSVPLIGSARLLSARSPALHLLGARSLSLSCEDSASAHAVVPVIDLTPYFTGGTPGKKQVAREINHACEKIGFFTITGHGVPLQTIRNMQDCTKRFFDLPVKDKQTVKMTEEYPYGYSGFLGESLSTGYGDANSHPDLKECFAIGPYNPAALSPAIQWPSKPEDMPRAWLGYYKAMEGLASDLLRLFALALGIPEHFFEDKIDHHRSALRALNYPETDRPILPGQLRAGAHTDYGSLTILLQDEVGGLQVTPRHGVWQDVPYIPDSFIINIGDLMALWTNDKWLSTPHRVVPKKPRRQSIAFFHNVNHDHLVTCIDTCKSPSNPAKYAPILAWDHLMSKHLASVGQKKAGKH